MKRKNLCGKRVKLARIEKDLKQVEMAAALSVDHDLDLSQDSISRIEMGTRSVSDIELTIFAKFFDVSVEWLLFGERKP